VSVSAQRPVEPLDAEAIWRDFHGRLLGFIARRVPDGDIAEDILQDVMLRIHRHAGELEHAPALSAWVHQIARNAITDHYRRAPVRRERPAGFDLDREEQVLPEPISAELRSELAECLGPLLGRLPAKQREALTLTELEGLTQASAAARLGLSTSGMKSRVQRARAQLKQLLDACCEIDLDRRGDITSYQSRRGPCDCRTGDCRADTPAMPER
jgi:RNA polymerase sigma-70 factor, ECF subfamily